MSTEREAEFREDEERVEARSAVFRKELGLFDLVLTQVMFVVGTSWVGAAAKLGHEQIVFWVAAVLLYYVPQAAVVIYLSRRMPLEGGLYQWSKLGFNDFVGFMVGWNLWVFTIVVMAPIGLVVARGLSYAFGPAGAWMGENKVFIAATCGVLVAAIMLATIRGLALGKWVHNACGTMLIVAFATLILLPVAGVLTGGLPEYHPLEAALPTFTLLNVNIFSKLALGALSGLEYVAIVAGECRDPSRTIGRSVVIATPLIALMFILGTSAVLAFVGPGEVDLISPIPQVLSLGFRPFGIASVVAPVAILMLVSRSIGNVSMTFTGNTRLPMVAGWDDLMPAWFTRIHPRYKTPVNSALFVGAVTFALGIVSLVGVGEQEAFQLLDNAAGVFYAMAYVALFAIPLFGLRASGERVPAWLKALSACGLLVTLLYIALSVFPIVEVESWLLYGLKISGVIVAANLVGVALYVAAARRRASRGV